VITHETLVLAAPSLPDDGSLDVLLCEIAELEAGCAHTYFVERHVKGRSWMGNSSPRRNHCRGGCGGGTPRAVRPGLRR